MSDLQKAGRYEIIGRIGEGGFGVVYKGRDPFMKRLVAIKTCTSENDETQKRFLREAEIAGNIEHPNVTVLYDFGYEDNVPYLVQEFLTGKDLDHRLHDGEPLTLTQKLDILLQMSQGLGFAHEQGVTHRDIKPGNVRITDEDRVKIMDFGIAKIASAESQLTQTGTTLGTPAYLSPEQLRGDPVDQRSDIYSYGVLAFELLTYRRMFEAETISALFFQILHQDSPQVASVWKDCPKSIDDIIGRCVAKEPGDRYPSFREVILDLQPLIEHYEANPSELPPEQPVPAAKPEDQASIAEGERQVAVTRARDQIEELLVSGDLKQAARALVTARRQHGDPLPLRTLHERLIQMQTQSGHLQATVEDTPATQTAAQRIDEFLFAGDLDQARAELMEARQEIGDTPGLLAAEERVDAVVVAEEAAGNVAQAREQLEAGALSEAESLLDQARTLAPDAEGLETALRDLESRKVKARAGVLAGEARQLLRDGNLSAALEKVDLATAEAGTDNDLEQLRSEIEAALAERDSEDTVVPTSPELDPHEDATVMAASPLADAPDLRNALPDAGEAPTQMVPSAELAATEEATQFVPHVEPTQEIPQVEATQPAVPQVDVTQPAVPQVEPTQPAVPAQAPAADPPKPSFKPPPKQETSSGLDPRVLLGAAAGV
ncbi:MAG: protein kinase, partial [Acidobacteriota bacterium]